jgi:hypothetical protein
MEAEMIRVVRMGLGAISALVAGIFLLAYYDRYWKWRDCFNELGRCWDSATEQVYVEQAGMIWGGGAALFGLIALGLLWGIGRGAGMSRRRTHG